MSKAKFREWYSAKYPRYNIMRLESRLDDVDAWGSDKPGHYDADQITKDNRAGYNGYPLTKEELLAMYCPFEDWGDYQDVEEYQRVSYFKERPQFLNTLTQEVRELFPGVERYGRKLDVEKEDTAKTLLALIDDDQASVEVTKDNITSLWNTKIVSKKKGKEAKGEGFDNNRNVAVAVAAVNWKTALEARDRADGG